jgi:hypothetical protein
MNKQFAVRYKYRQLQDQIHPDDRKYGPMLRGLNHDIEECYKSEEELRIIDDRLNYLASCIKEDNLKKQLAAILYAMTREMLTNRK